MIKTIKISGGGSGSQFGWAMWSLPNTSWDTCVNANGNNHGGEINTQEVMYVGGDGGPSYGYTCFRGIVGINTSVLAGATIHSAKLYLKCTAKNNFRQLSPFHFGCYQMSSAPDWNTDDYQKKTNILCSDLLNYEDIVAGQWFNFNLYVSQINKGGLTYFTIRNSEYDANILTPGGVYPYLATDVQSFGSGAIAANQPYLEVDYTPKPAYKGNIHIDQLIFQHAERVPV